MFPEVAQHYSSLALTHSCSVCRLRLAFSSLEVYVGQRKCFCVHWLTVFIARQRVKHLLGKAQAELREHFHLSAVWTRWNVMHMGKGATTALTFFPQNPLYIYLFICVTSVYKGITPLTRHSNLFKKQTIRSIIPVHASGC